MNIQDPPIPELRRAFRPVGPLVLLAAVLVLSGCNAMGVGRNVDARLGLGHLEDTNVVANLDTAVTFDELSAGTNHSCGITTDRALYCWGSNTSFRVGVPNGTDTRSPVRVGTANDWVSVSAGGDHSCGLRAPGRLFCWGGNAFRQVNPSVTALSVQEPTQIGSFNAWAAVSAGQQHTCGIQLGQGESRLFCWGSNADGRLGNGSPSGHGSTFVPIGQLEDWQSVDVGIHTCGIRAGGQLFCWGANADGQLGVGDREPRPTPVRVGAASDWREVGTGDRHSCGLRLDGTMFCWGQNFDGQIGDGSFTRRLTPVTVPSPDAWLALGVGDAHTCGLREDGPSCWGANAFGALGDGTNVDRGVPTPMVGVETEVVDVEAGRHSTLLVSA